MKEYVHLGCLGLVSGAVSVVSMEYVPNALKWFPGVVFGFAIIGLFARVVVQSMIVRLSAIAIITLGYFLVMKSAMVTYWVASNGWLRLMYFGALGSIFVLFAIYMNAKSLVDAKTAIMILVVGSLASSVIRVAPIYSVFPPQVGIRGWPLSSPILPLVLWQTAVALTLAGPLRKARQRAKNRGVPTCTSCGYDLTGNVSGICPECGTAIEKGAQLASGVPGKETGV